VDIAIKVGASLSRRTVGHQRSNRIKGCLECVSGKKHIGNENEKARKLICDKFKCLNCGGLGHRKKTQCPLNRTKKANISYQPKISPSHHSH
jgi:hypothetical protein